MVQVRIDRLANGAEGVGPQLDGMAAGRTVFVAGGVPGDVLTVHLTEQKKRYARGTLAKIASRSPSRVDSPCSVFPTCGGCAWLHIGAETQREALEGNLRFMLRPIAEPGTVQEPIKTGASYQYRRRLRLHCDWDVHGVRFGFFEAGKHQLVTATGCQVATPALTSVLGSLGDVLSKHRDGNRGRGTLVLAEDGEENLFVSVRGNFLQGVLPALLEVGFAGARLETETRTLEVGEAFMVWHSSTTAPPLRIRNGSFFQANMALFGELVRDLEGVLGDLAGKHVVELFCGSGTLTLPFHASAWETWTGIDASSNAIQSVRAATRDRGGYHFVIGNHPEALAESERGGADVCLLDPPREGAAEWMDWIGQQGFGKVVYVSCNPITMARDLQTLKAFGYVLEHVVPYDMFPHTGHMEVLTVMRKE